MVDTRKEARKEKRKEKIFKAAVKCFNNKGYYETTIDAIAAKAKVSKGLIYYYFESKKELFLELFQYRVGKYFEQIKHYIEEEQYPDARLKMFINKSSQILKENEDFFKFCLEFLSLGVREPEIRDVMTIFYKDSIGTFKQLLEEGVKSGRFKDLGSDRVARTIYFLFMGVFFTYFSVNVDFDLYKQHNFHISNILTAIKQ
jgi:AcrR family transcriptional regulator